MNTTSLPLQAGRPSDGDADLLRRLRAGDDAAYEALVRRYSGRMLAVARRFLGNEDDSADVVQEAFCSAFQAIHRFEGEAALSTWLHRIVVNACLTKLRSRRRRRTLLIEDLLPAFDESGHHAQPVAAWCEPPSRLMEQDETRHQVRACIDMLPDDHRAVLLLRDIEELDTMQTAEVLGISVPAVKTRLHRARQALRSLLEPHFASSVEGSAGERMRSVLTSA